jgi:hypothetical protein
MQIFNLVVQIFMSVSLIAGISMLILTVGYRHVLRKNERICRYILGCLLIYSVITRFLIMLPREFSYMKEMSIGFDILYLTLCIFYNITLFDRKREKR